MLQLNGQQLTLQQIADIAEGREQVVLADEARVRVERARQVVQDIVMQGRTVYGVNTGFGKLSDVSIDRADLIQLQLNLVRSHSCKYVLCLVVCTRLTDRDCVDTAVSQS